MDVVRPLLVLCGIGVLFLPVFTLGVEAQQTEVLYVNGQWVTVSEIGRNAQEIQVGDRTYEVVRQGSDVQITQTWPLTSDTSSQTVPAIRVREPTGFGGSAGLGVIQGLMEGIDSSQPEGNTDLVPHLRDALDLIEEQREALDDLNERYDSLWYKQLRWQADAALIQRLDSVVALAGPVSARIERHLESDPENQRLEDIQDGLNSAIGRALDLKQTIIERMTSRPRDPAIQKMADEVMKEWEFARWEKVLEDPDEWLPKQENPFLPGNR